MNTVLYGYLFLLLFQVHFTIFHDFDNSFKVSEDGTETLSGDVEYTMQTAQGRLISRRKESAGDDAVNSENEGD